MSESVPVLIGGGNGHGPDLSHEQKTALQMVAGMDAGIAEAVRVFVGRRLNGDPEPAARYVVRSAADALQPQPPIDYVVDGLITTGSLNLFYGEPGSKKTYALLSLSVCVANGLSWLGFSTTGRKVLIVDEESGDRRLTRRLGEALRGEDAGPETPISYVSLAGFKLDDRKGIDQTILQALIEDQAAGLVIIDALADVTDGDENAKAEIQPVFNSLRKIAEATDAAILLIHHANKAGGYRGSSAIKGAVDSMVRVESEPGKNLVNFYSEKARDGIGHEWAAIATWRDDSFTLRPCSPEEDQVHLSKPERFVLSYLEDSGPRSIPEIMAAADICSANSAKFAVYSLTDKGKIYRTNPGEGGRGVSAIYATKKVENDFPF